MIKGIIRILAKLLSKVIMPKTDLSYYSGSIIDQVLFSQVINTSVVNSVASSTLNYGSTTIGQFAWPIGIYSYDGGLTYNDFVPTTLPGGSLLTHATSTTAPAVFVTPKVDASGNLTFAINVKSTVGAGGTIPLILKIALLATATPSSTFGPPIQSSNDNPQAYGSIHRSQPLQNRQINTDATSPLSAGVLNIFTIAHGLGVIPNPQVWHYDTFTNTIKGNFWRNTWKPIGANNGDVTGIAMDSTNLYISPEAALTNSYQQYRLYKEN